MGELLDVVGVIKVFWRVRSAVKSTALKVGGSSKAYAVNDFIVDEDDSTQRITHSGKDLKAEYYLACKQFRQMLAITAISTWLIGYALLKYFCAVRCEHGVWTLAKRCGVPPVDEPETGPAQYCLKPLF